MKIINDYDLLEKVENAKGSTDYKKEALREFKKQLLLYTFLTGGDMILLGASEIDWLFNLAFCGGFAVADTVVPLAYRSSHKEHFQYAAYSKLEELAGKMENLHINTNAKLLLDSELYKTEYHLSGDSIILPIRQDKYMTVPVEVEMGGIKRASVLQEHHLGSGEYILSLGSPHRDYRIAYV